MEKTLLEYGVFYAIKFYFVLMLRHGKILQLLNMMDNITITMSTQTVQKKKSGRKSDMYEYR